MNKSDSIGKLAAALSKAQSQMEPAKKDTKGNFGKFADLGEVIDTIRKVSTPNGLSFSQFPVGDSAGVGVSTILMHESGEWLSDTIYLPSSEAMGGRNGAQLAGGNITYLRRYALASVFGVYADEDTDGTQRQPQTQHAQRSGTPAPQDRKPVVNPTPPTFNDVPTNGTTRHTQEEFMALVKSSKVRNTGEIVKSHSAGGTTDWNAAYLELADAAKALA